MNSEIFKMKLNPIYKFSLMHDLMDQARGYLTGPQTAFKRFPPPLFFPSLFSPLPAFPTRKNAQGLKEVDCSQKTKVSVGKQVIQIRKPVPFQHACCMDNPMKI